MRLKHRRDFVVIDAVVWAMGRMIHADAIEGLFRFDAGVDWLCPKHWKGGKLIRYTH